MVGTRGSVMGTRTRSRPGQLASLPMPSRKSGIKRKAVMATPAPRKIAARTTRKPASPPRDTAENRLAAQMNLVFKQGRGGRRVDINGKNRKVRKYTYTKTNSGRVVKRSKIYQGQFYKVGHKSKAPMTSGAVVGRKIPSGFRRFASKRNTLIKMLAERAGLSTPRVENYKSYMQAVSKVNVTRPKNLGLMWR